MAIPVNGERQGVSCAKATCAIPPEIWPSCSVLRSPHAALVEAVDISVAMYDIGAGEHTWLLTRKSLLTLHCSGELP